MSNTGRSLEKSIAIGAAWMVSIRLSYRLLGLISTVILARLLTPDDFGVVAIAMSFFALIDVFSKLGFQTALIQNQSATEEHYHSAWTFNFLFGIVSAAILFLASSPIAEFYERQELEVILWVISFMFVLNGLKNIGTVEFQKELTFDKEFKLIVIPKFISFFCTIALALYFLNFWALVIGNVIWRLLEVVVSYWMHPFRPRFCVSKGKELFKFSRWMIVNNVFIFIQMRSPEMILGKMVSPQGAAIYNLSNEIGTMSTSEVIANLNRAIYPGYAKVSHDRKRLTELYHESIRAIALFAMPLGVGVALLAEFVVPVMLGSQWLDAREPLIYLALGGAVNALSSNLGYIYYALNKPRLSTVVHGIKATVFLCLLFSLINLHGVVGAAQAYMLSALVSFMVSMRMLKSVLGVSLRRQFSFYWQPAMSTALMAMVIILLKPVLALAGILAILAFGLIGAAIYTSCVYIFWVRAGKPGGIERTVFSSVSKIFARFTRRD